MNDTGAIHDFSPRCAKTTLAFQSVLSLDPSNIQVSCMFTAVPVRNSSSTNTTGSADAGTVGKGTTRLPVKQEQDLIEALDSADGRCAATANDIQHFCSSLVCAGSGDTCSHPMAWCDWRCMRRMHAQAHSGLG